MSWVVLSIAIIAEVAGSTLLMKTEQFTRLIPTVGTLLLYGIAFYCLSLSLRHIPLGIAYSVWAGVGIVLTVISGVVIFQQRLDIAAVVGVSLIIIGVMVINLLSSTSTH
nr:multidrug efflux SMR transporter [Carnimonas nigrificans]